MDTLIQLARAIGENGILILIGAMFLIFMSKNFKSFLDKDKLISNSIVPKLDEILSGTTEAKQQIINLVTNHNSSSANKFNNINKELQDIMVDYQKLLVDINAVKKDIQEEVITIKKDIQVLRNEINDLNMENTLLLKDYKATLADMKIGCPAICSRETLINQLIIKGICTKEEIDSVITEVVKDR